MQRTARVLLERALNKPSSPGNERRVSDEEHGTRATKRVIATLEPGEVFGDLGCVMDEKRTASIVSVVWSETWDMGKMDFMTLCEEFVELRAYVRNKVIN
jgi:hypothetical protein